MDHPGRALRRGAWVAAGLVAGGLVLVLLIIQPRTPSEGATHPPPSLTTIQVEAVPFRVEARGRGTVRPVRTWQATASVAGPIVERHPELESGNILPKGTRLLAQDPTRPELAMDRARAEQERGRAEMERLTTEANNTRRLLELEQERLDLAEQELERVRRLAQQENLSQSRLDNQRRNTLARRQAVAGLENELALIPIRRTLLQAQEREARIRVEEAREELADTRVDTPFDLRIEAAPASLHDDIQPGQQLVRGHGIEAMEVEAHFPVAAMRRLMGAVSRAAEPDVTPAERSADAPSGLPNPRRRLAQETIEAEVILAGDETTRWSGRVTRVASGLDPETRTLRVVVRVEDPYQHVHPPDRPGLQPGMYTRVRLRAPSPEPRLVVPASAVHDGAVYLVTDQGRLARQPVRSAFQQRDLAIITDGLSPGMRVIVDDPVMPVEGMPIDPQRDPEREEELRRRAGGGTP